MTIRLEAGLSPSALLERLEELGVASADDIAQAKREQLDVHERFGTLLARRGLLRYADSGRRLAAQLGWPPARIEPPPTPIRPEAPLTAVMCRGHRIVVLERTPDGHLTLATDDPLTLFSLEWLERLTRAHCELVLVPTDQLDGWLAQLEQQPLLPSGPELSTLRPAVAPTRSAPTTASPAKAPAPPTVVAL